MSPQLSDAKSTGLLATDARVMLICAPAGPTSGSVDVDDLDMGKLAVEGKYGRGIRDMVARADGTGVALDSAILVSGSEKQKAVEFLFANSRLGLYDSLTDRDLFFPFLGYFFSRSGIQRSVPLAHWHSHLPRCSPYRRRYQILPRYPRLHLYSGLQTACDRSFLGWDLGYRGWFRERNDRNGFSRGEE